MSNTDNNHNHIYYVDPGIGSKSRSCPYTHYQDGRDVYSYIYPPKGYELTGFKLEPYELDKFYDGKIVAQYEKTSFSDRLNQNLWLYVLASIAFIGILAMVAYYVFDLSGKPKPVIQPEQEPKTEIQTLPVDTTVQNQVFDTSTIIEDTLIVQDTLIEELENEATALDEVIKENTEITEAALEESVQIEGQPIEEPIENKVKENEVTPTVTETQSQPTETEEVLTKEQFRQEFWTLIHHKETHMRAYGNLYRKYKSLNLKTREFYYLYLTILENGNAFNIWKDKLLSIPDDELKSIHSISALEQKIEEYE